ncbi:MAG: hypothetical protein WA532_03510 [Candidatus Korobacteraceae bacterium]|jgi:hypothetical protein
MFKFRVMLVALAATAVIAAGQVGVAQASPVLHCTNGGDEAGSPGTLAGTYTFSFFGAYTTGVPPIAGTGSVTLNGNGKVTGGIIRCNQYTQYNTPITGGCYTINSDGTGFIAITTALPVCHQFDGVDLGIAVSQPGGVQFQFSSDGGLVNSDTGYYDVFSGTANRP